MGRTFLPEPHWGLVCLRCWRHCAESVTRPTYGGRYRSCEISQSSMPRRLPDGGSDMVRPTDFALTRIRVFAIGIRSTRSKDGDLTRSGWITIVATSNGVLPKRVAQDHQRTPHRG